MVHYLLEPLAEGAPSNPRTAVRLWEGQMADGGHHSVLFHHGVGYPGDLPEVILGPWTKAG